MQYKQQKTNNINYSEINTNRFKTNLIDISFTTLTDGLDNAYSNLLANVLNYNTKKYNSKIALAKKLEELYSCNIFSNVSIIGNIKTFHFSIKYINSKYLDENIDKEALDMLFEMIFNPNVDNNCFDKETFLLSKSNIIDTIKRMNEYPLVYSINEFIKVFNNNTPIKYPSIGLLEDYDLINEKNLYNYYKKVLNMNIDVNVIGDIDSEEIKKYIVKKLKNYKINNNNIKNIYLNNRIKNKVKIVKEKKEFNQSQLLLGYKFKNLSDYEKRYVAPLYSIILGGDINSLLFTTLREKHGLCYGINSGYNRYDNTLIISSGINKKNYDISLKLIKECILQMKDEKTITKLLEIAKKNIFTSLNIFYDDDTSMLNYAFLNNYDDIENVEKRKEIYDKVTVKEITNLNDKLGLDTIYFLEGVLEQ